MSNKSVHQFDNGIAKKTVHIASNGVVQCAVLYCPEIKQCRVGAKNSIGSNGPYSFRFDAENEIGGEGPGFRVGRKISGANSVFTIDRKNCYAWKTKGWEKMKVFVNILSISRILAAFAVVPLLLEQYFDLAFVVFAAACVSDWLDGFLAKKYKVETKIGGVLDHMGDKFLVTTTLIMMIMFLQIWSVLVPAVLMICRELYVSGLREFMGTQRIEMPVPKRRFSFGKIKTSVQMAALGAMLLWVWAVNADWQSEILTYYMLFVGIGGLWLALACSLFSAGEYTVQFAKNLKRIK